MNPFLLVPFLASAAFPWDGPSLWKSEFPSLARTGSLFEPQPLWKTKFSLLSPRAVLVSGGVEKKPKKHYANLLSKSDAIALVEKSLLYVKASESGPMTIGMADLSEGLAEHPTWLINISYEGRSPIPPQFNFFVDAVTSELYGYDRRQRGAIVEYYQKNEVDGTRIFSWEVGKAKKDPAAKPSPMQNTLRTIIHIGESALQPTP
jgi:hypothetical protein